MGKELVKQSVTQDLQGFLLKHSNKLADVIPDAYRKAMRPERIVKLALIGASRSPVLLAT